MPRAAASGKDSIDSIRPSDDEIKAAKLILNNSTSAAKRSKMACMTAWLKRNADGAGNDAALGSRGQTREDYLLKYLVSVNRKQNATSSTIAEQSSSSSKTNNMDFYYWNKFVMDRELGAKVGEVWRKSGKLRWEPCPVTGDESEDLKVWACPQRWVNNKEEAAKSMRVQGNA